MHKNKAHESDIDTLTDSLIYSALQQNIHKCLYKFQITASNFFTIRQYAFKSFPCSLKFLRRIFCIFCCSAEYNLSPTVGLSGAVGVPKRSRTSGLLLRRQSLYPTELLGHNIYILPYYSPYCKSFDIYFIVLTLFSFSQHIFVNVFTCIFS